MRARALGLIGLMGGLGGAINAWLCYAKIPTPVVNPSVFGDLTPNATIEFAWSLIPAGAYHGAVVALISVGSAMLLRQRPWVIRWALLPVVWWLVAWLSFIPFWTFHWSPGPGGDPPHPLWVGLLWPISFALPEPGWSSLVTWAGIVPLWAGSVGGVYYGVLSIGRGISSLSLRTHLLLSSFSACMGSLAWWMAWQPWYFSLIHGIIWGSLVGYGVWKSQDMTSPATL